MLLLVPATSRHLTYHLEALQVLAPLDDIALVGTLPTGLPVEQHRAVVLSLSREAYQSYRHRQSRRMGVDRSRIIVGGLRVSRGVRRNVTGSADVIDGRAGGGLADRRCDDHIVEFEGVNGYALLLPALKATAL